MPAVVFIDTSVLCNLVPVPGRDQSTAALREDMRRRSRAGEQFVLPITAVVETGNFIAQVPDGTLRRESALRLAEMLRLVCDRKAPWVLHDLAWGSAFLMDFLDGADTQVDYVAHAQNKLGAGDLCILTERWHYQRRTGIRAEIWTTDAGLAAYGA